MSPVHSPASLWRLGRFARAFACALVLALAVPAMRAEEDPPSAARSGGAVHEGIVYTKRGEQELGIDIAEPAGEGADRPAVLCIHGGGWRAGDRGAYSGLIRELSSRGFVAASASYRLSDMAPWPAQREDVLDALAWLAEHAGDYGIDTGRIGVLGHSAGGHLSLVLGTRLTPGEAGIRVRAVVNFFGPTDLSAAYFRPDSVRLIEHLVGGPREEREELVHDASPLLALDRSDAPVITFHGTEDEIVPFKQAEAFHERMAEVGVPGRLESVEDAGHGWGGDAAGRTAREAFEFLHAYLAGSDLPLLLREDFSSGTERWEPTDAAAWKRGEEHGDAFLSLVKKRSDYEPPVRSPYNIALLRGVQTGDMVFDVRLRSTNERYGHQDLCLVFGWQDPAHYYYVHLGRQADAHANSIFLVDGAPRRSIADERTDGTDWSEGWHRARVARDTSTGRIEVYFDDMTRPVMVAEDRTFLRGRVGVGSFDDTGDFDAIHLRGRPAEGEGEDSESGESEEADS